MRPSSSALVCACPRLGPLSSAWDSGAGDLLREGSHVKREGQADKVGGNVK